MPSPFVAVIRVYEVIKTTKKERYRSDILWKCWGARLFLSSHIWEIPWAGGVLERWAVLVCASPYWKRFFLLSFLLPGNNGELVWVDFLGELMRRRCVQIEWGKRLVLFVLECFFYSLQQLLALLLEGGGAWILSCLVLLFAALTTREPLCYWIF